VCFQRFYCSHNVTWIQPPAPAPHHQPQRSLSRSLRHQGDLSDWAFPRARATGLATGSLERAAIAATMAASRWEGRKLLARQTSNQRHSETLLAQELKARKPWNGKERPKGLCIRRARFPPVQIARSQGLLQP